ncbi:hypothetical protein [uncultured Fenollaria sp.]|uniref:hypothetical protein n=1 Tax=uncultured Fenollaria sp. TaxID=1686315 RepID=UPI0025D4272C|nr:hypothetical protein [uncultured Fenollaria sp.]
MEKKNSSSIIGMIGVLILIIILYNSMFSSRAKMDKNLKDLADTKEFLSTEVDKEVLDYIYEQKGYAMMKKSEAKDYQKLGTVRMVGKNNNTINTFDVYVNGEIDYAINMRGIYMKVLDMKGKK